MPCDRVIARQCSTVSWKHRRERKSLLNGGGVAVLEHSQIELAYRVIKLPG
jgi:hypothetical protein